MNCKYCKADCANRGYDEEKQCLGFIPQTNADRIRAMSDEELTDYAYKVLGNYCCPPEREFLADNCMGFECSKCWLDWLKQEATE